MRGGLAHVATGSTAKTRVAPALSLDRLLIFLANSGLKCHKHRRRFARKADEFSLQKIILFRRPLMSSGDNQKLINQKTETRLSEISGRTQGALGFFALDLTSREQFGFNEHNIFPQASAIKIPILMEVYKQAGEGRFKLSDTRRIEKHDKTPGSGVLFELGDGTVQMNLHDLWRTR